MPDPIVPQLEGDEYLLWEARQVDRHELHHGFVVAFAGGTIGHDTVGLNLLIALRRCYPQPCRTFGSNVKVEITSSTYFYADAGVVGGPTADSATVLREPLVVCEVLSERTRSYDVIEKRAAYRTLPSLAVYLIVHTSNRRIEFDARVSGGVWQTTIFDEGNIPLGSDGTTLDEIYGQTTIGVDESE